MPARPGPGTTTSSAGAGRLWRPSWSPVCAAASARRSNSSATPARCRIPSARVELGKFPDDNVADSLSHITGVAISRTAGGEGQKVSVRGLGPEYTLTTFNGRILATDGAGRDFAFDVLPADVISGADVIKGAQASLTEGAIGGLVNLRSASPFDQNRPAGDRAPRRRPQPDVRAQRLQVLGRLQQHLRRRHFRPAAGRGVRRAQGSHRHRRQRRRLDAQSRIPTTRAGCGAMPGAATSIPTAMACSIRTNTASSAPASSASARSWRRRSAAPITAKLEWRPSDNVQDHRGRPEDAPGFAAGGLPAVLLPAVRAGSLVRHRRSRTASSPASRMDESRSGNARSTPSC